MLTGPEWAKLVHPDDWQKVRAAWLSAVETGTLYEVELRIRRGDGVYRWHLVRALPIRGGDGAIEQWIGTNTDIEDQKAALQAYAELNATLEKRVAESLAERKVFSDVIDGSTAAVTALDLDFRILAINKANIDAFERVFGKRPRVGDVFLDLFGDLQEHVAQQRDIWQRALGGEEFTRSLSSHLMPKGIRVNAVAPGPVWTPLNPADKDAPEVAHFGEDTPMGRPAQPEEIAPAYVFLASPQTGSYITGEILPIIGGYHN